MSPVTDHYCMHCPNDYLHLCVLFSSTLISCVPCLQCLRRYHDEGDKVQLEGAGRLMSVFTAVALRQAYGNNRSRPGYEVPLRVLFMLASVITTSISNYWDICHDWGLLNSKSKNKWLRDKLILKRKYIYFVAMVSNRAFNNVDACIACVDA